MFENYGFNYEAIGQYPSAQLYSLENSLIERLLEKYANDERAALIDKSLNLPITPEMIEMAISKRDGVQLANLKYIHFEFFCLHVFSLFASND